MITILDFIKESLKSHDGNKLLNKLLEKYPDDIVYYKTNGKEGNEAVILLAIKYDKSYDKEKDKNAKTDDRKSDKYPIFLEDEFKNLLKFFGYEISTYNYGNFDEREAGYFICDWAKISKSDITKNKLNEDNIFLLCIEPKMPKNVNDYIYNDCNGVIFKVLRHKNPDISLDTDSLFKNGLKLTTRFSSKFNINNMSKSDFDNLRYSKLDPNDKNDKETIDILQKFYQNMWWHMWEDRQYFIAAPTAEEVIKTINYINRSRFGNMAGNTIHVVKIDLKKHNLNLNFYRDVFLKNENTFYTKTASIPGKYLEYIKCSRQNIKKKITV